MKFFFRPFMALFMVFVILTACSSPPVREMAMGAGVGADLTPHPEKAAYLPEIVSECEFAPDEPQPVPAIYIPDETLSPEQVVEEYFRQQYISYTELEYIDISSIVDTSLSRMRNMLAWLEMLIQRRRLILENELCYVDTRMLPYEIRYISETDLEDERVNFWRNSNITYDNEIMMHFIIKGIPGEAYPPTMAVNTQQSIRLKLIGGEWKISFHYFPGSVRKFRWLEPLEIPSDEETLEMLLEEFDSSLPFVAPSEVPDGAALYDGELSAIYSKTFTEKNNPAFYNIGDWMGNCANFTSQCIWYGFGEGEDTSYAVVNMSANWYAGEGGGSPSWENVGYFWDYAIDENTPLCGRELAGITQAQPGDLIQTHARDFNTDDPERFNHSLILADKDTLLLAQNSPGAFVYYSDLVNVETRLFRPEYLY